MERINKPYILQLKEIGEFQDYQDDCFEEMSPAEMWAEVQYE